jgi:hypothetical protein
LVEKIKYPCYYLFQQKHQNFNQPIQLQDFLFFVTPQFKISI